MTLIVAFRNFAKAPKNSTFCPLVKYLCTGLDRLQFSRRLRLTEFLDSQHRKVTGQPHTSAGLTPTEDAPGTHCCYRMSQPQGHSGAERIMSMKTPTDTFGNRTFRLVARCLNQLRHRMLTASRKRAGQWGCSNSGKGKIFLSSPNLADRLWGPHSLVLNWYHISSPGLKRPGHDVNHSPLSIAEVKNVYRYIYTPLICLRGQEWEKLRFLIFSGIISLEQVQVFFHWHH
jgi:hypothetical protein